MNPQISVVVPVFNEEEGLQYLFDRLYPVMDQLGRSYEVILVDDGSADRSVAVLREQFAQRPETTRIIVLARNVGQHMAILAGFAQARGYTGVRGLTLRDTLTPHSPIAKARLCRNVRVRAHRWSESGVAVPDHNS